MEHEPLASASSRRNVSHRLRGPPPLHCLWPKAALFQTHWPTFPVLHRTSSGLRPGHATCLDSPRPLRKPRQFGVKMTAL